MNRVTIILENGAVELLDDVSHIEFKNDGKIEFQIDNSFKIKTVTLECKILSIW